MSFFKGLGELYTSAGKLSSQAGTAPNTGLAIVLDVELTEGNSPADVGRIRIKPIGSSNREEDDKLAIYAYPADRRNISYPLPGEHVFIFAGISDNVKNNGVPIQTLFYSTNLTQNNSITYNSLPNVGDRITEPSTLSKRVINFTQVLLKKFNSKLNSIDSFVKSYTNEGVEIKERPSLLPFEGDVVHQGRFGQSIRFGSTSGDSNDTPWSKEGLSGNPITIIRVHDQIVNGDITYVTEDINRDNSSIYLASTQNIPLKLSCGTKMLSWQTTYKLQSSSPDAVKGANVASSKSNTQAAYVSADRAVAEQVPIISESPQTVETPATTQPSTADCRQDASISVSPNWKLSELSCAAQFPHKIPGAGQFKWFKYGKTNLSREQVIANLTALATNIIEPITARYGKQTVIDTNAYRNNGNGSQHEGGQAVDIQFRNIRGTANQNNTMVIRAEEIKALLNNHNGYDQLLLEYRKGSQPWIHISFVNPGAAPVRQNRNQIITMVDDKSYYKGRLANPLA